MRVYLPVTGADLRTLAAGDRLTAPRGGHAVTAELHAVHPDADQEELEYLATMAAAHDSLLLLARSGDPLRRRAVLAVEITDTQLRSGADRAVVSGIIVSDPVGLEQVAAVHVDGDDAAADLTRALEGDADALDEHELLWYARQELAGLLA